MINYLILDSKGWFKDKKFLNASNSEKFYFLNNKNDLTAEYLEIIKPRFIFFVHWSWKVEASLHEKYDCIIFHTAPLPFGRGGSPIQNLILLGFKSSPVYALKMTEDLDAGPTYMKRDLSLLGNLEEIFKRLSRIVAEMINEICHSKELTCRPQSEDQIYYFKRLNSQNNRINFFNQLEKIYDQIRMVDGYDYPRAYLDQGDSKIEFTNSILKDKFIIAKAKIYKKEKKLFIENNDLSKCLITFEVVNKNSSAHISYLYNLLKNRKYNISHSKMPNYKEHNDFVKNHPYLNWYLVKESENYIGSTYVMEDNCVGIDMEDDKFIFLKEIIDFIKKNHKPKPAIKSVRPANFFVNVSPKDQIKINALENSKAILLQTTYLIK